MDGVSAGAAAPRPPPQPTADFDNTDQNEDVDIDRLEMPGSTTFDRKVHVSTEIRAIYSPCFERSFPKREVGRWKDIYIQQPIILCAYVIVNRTPQWGSSGSSIIIIIIIIIKKKCRVDR